VKWIDEVLEHSLVHMPVPDTKSEDAKPKPEAGAKEEKSEDVVRPH
jgi:hypothetical protein